MHTNSYTGPRLTRLLSEHCSDRLPKSEQMLFINSVFRNSDYQYRHTTLTKTYSWLCSRRHRPLAHDVIAPVTMHLEDKLAIYA